MQRFRSVESKLGVSGLGQLQSVVNAGLASLKFASTRCQKPDLRQQPHSALSSPCVVTKPVVHFMRAHASSCCYFDTGSVWHGNHRLVKAVSCPSRWRFKAATGIASFCKCIYCRNVFQRNCNVVPANAVAGGPGAYPWACHDFNPGPAAWKFYKAGCESSMPLAQVGRI